jgi:hypothetical protein
MGPFNRGEVEYIKAISGGHSHHTFKAVESSWTLSAAPSNSDSFPGDARTKYTVLTTLDPKVYDPTNHPNDPTNKVPIAFSSQFTNAHTNVPVYTIRQSSTPDSPALDERRGEQFFLDKVTGRLRIVLPLASGHQSDHIEYRLLVFRHKERQHFDQERALNFCNPEYDLWLGSNNYKYGPRGYRNKDIISGNEEYAAYSGSNFQQGQYFMTAMLNKEDYIFMKDTRFYLGKEYGGKHIYETMLSWDHRDQLESEEDIIIDSESATKNYCWYVYLVRTSNDPSSSTFTDPTNIDYAFTTTGTS